MRTVKIAFCMLAEALACILLPLAIGRAAESDEVTPVAVAVCALAVFSKLGDKAPQRVLFGGSALLALASWVGIAVFGAANESSYYTDFAIKAFRTYLCMMVLACVNKACFIFLQAVGTAGVSSWLSLGRVVVCGVGFALLRPRVFGLDGVLYSMPVSDVLTFVIAAVMIVKTYRELNTEGATVL